MNLYKSVVGWRELNDGMEMRRKKEMNKKEGKEGWQECRIKVRTNQVDKEWKVGCTKVANEKKMRTGRKD